MSVEFRWGYTGSGKSYITMLDVVDHLYEGGVVGLNFRLKDDWAYICALRHPKFKNGRMSFDECVKSLHSRCFFVGSVGTIEQLAKMAPDFCEGWARQRRERKTLIVIDEAQLYLNSRNFRENFPWMQLGTQHRKMGLDILLLGHHISMIDNQVEHLISFVSRAYNLYEQWRFPGTNLRFPIPFLCLFTRQRDRGSKTHPRIIGPIRSHITELYDSYEIFAYDALPTAIEHQGRLNDDFVYHWPRKRLASADWPGRDRYWLNLLDGFDPDFASV